jgi:hypothetical protein
MEDLRARVAAVNATSVEQPSERLLIYFGQYLKSDRSPTGNQT